MLLFGLQCDPGWVNNGSYRVEEEEAGQDVLECVEPATLVIAGYSTKPEAASSGRIGLLMSATVLS